MPSLRWFACSNPMHSRLDRSFVVPCSRPDTPPRPPRTLPPRHRPCSATDPSNRPEQRRSTHHGTRANRASAPAGPCAQLKVGVTVFNHPPPCAPILTLSHGPHPACAAHVRNLNAAPGACSPHDMSRLVSTSACGLAMEPSNGVHTTPTHVTHNHHHHHHHHHHPPLAFTPPKHPDDRPRSAEHFIAKVSAVRLAGGGGASRRA